MAREYDYTNLFEKANKEIDLLENSSNKQEQEIFIEVKMALVEIKQFCEADKNIPIWEVVQKYYDNALTHLLSSQEKKLKDAEKYCVLQKETPELLLYHAFPLMAIPGLGEKGRCGRAAA